MLIIWIQSSYFNPNSLEGIHLQIGIPIFVILGVVFEIGHLFQFAILYFLLIMAFLTYGRLNSVKEMVAFIIALLYGILDEVHQIYVPFRSFSIIDLIKDAVGIIVIWFIIHKHYYKNDGSKIQRFLTGITNVYKKEDSNFPV
nr:VanZ family protein [Fredinandcohnia sp. SECRCQ15]